MQINKMAPMVALYDEIVANIKVQNINN